MSVGSVLRNVLNLVIIESLLMSMLPAASVFGSIVLGLRNHTVAATNDPRESPFTEWLDNRVCMKLWRAASGLVACVTVSLLIAIFITDVSMFALALDVEQELTLMFG